MSLWRKRNDVSHDGQNRPKLFTMTAMTDNDLSIQSPNLSIKQSKGIKVSKEALKLALEWIEKQPEETPHSKYDVDTRYVVIREIEAALAQPEQEGGVCGRCGGWVSDPVITQPEQDNAYIYASNLAKTIWQKHYIKESPKFALLDTTEGVLTQIDNMTCGLVREKPAQPEKEPMVWEQFYPDIGKPQLTHPPQGIYYTQPQRIWVDPPEGWKYGFPAIYDPEKDGQMSDWIISKGYPIQIIKEYGEQWMVRCWPAEEPH